MNEITPDDIRAMRRQGDLGRFLRQQIRRPRPALTSSAPAQRPAAGRLAVHRPGAWPPGTRPRGLLPPLPMSAWWAALDDYRRWAGTAPPTARPDASRHPCDCGAHEEDQ
ncbi:hypothetical protein [Wenjunlia vitaminophila]|uniref:hypothetical protein n=1 Tax=Wenjunlia vitaminophila TaxID=76728 RepID=UPI00131A05D0|nr:hypothetical protein [Wenjunlia vitaminophila]